MSSSTVRGRRAGGRVAAVRRRRGGSRRRDGQAAVAAVQHEQPVRRSGARARRRPPGRQAKQRPAARWGRAGRRRGWRRTARPRTGRSPRRRSAAAALEPGAAVQHQARAEARAGLDGHGAVVEVARSCAPKTWTSVTIGRRAAGQRGRRGDGAPVRAAVGRHVGHRRRGRWQGGGAEPALRQVAGQGLEPGADHPQVGLVRVVGEDGPDDAGLGRRASGRRRPGTGSGRRRWRHRRCCRGRPCRRRWRPCPTSRHVEGMNCIGPDRVVPAGVAVERAAVGVAADRDPDDRHLAVADHVQPADAVVGLGLADGGQQLPAQPAGRAARRPAWPRPGGRRRRPPSTCR